jgi:hypothetical protein
MVLNFEAESVEVETTEFNILAVGFYADENYLMIQQSLDTDAGQDYHIERDDQSYGGYGGVSQIVLEQNSIEVILDEAGKENLQCDGVKIEFETDAKTYELLGEKLKFIFGEAVKIN